MSAHLIHTKHQDGAATALRTALKQALKERYSTSGGVQGAYRCKEKERRSQDTHTNANQSKTKIKWPVEHMSASVLPDATLQYPRRAIDELLRATRRHSPSGARHTGRASPSWE